MSDCKVILSSFVQNVVMRFPHHVIYVGMMRYTLISILHIYGKEELTSDLLLLFLFPPSMIWCNSQYRDILPHSASFKLFVRDGKLWMDNSGKKIKFFLTSILDSYHWNCDWFYCHVLSKWIIHDQRFWVRSLVFIILFFFSQLIIGFWWEKQTYENDV